MTKLDHAKAKRQRPGKAERAAFQADGKRQQAMAAFVRRHKITCFKCSSAQTTWAKTGISTVRNQRRPWAICTACITHKRP